mmetsp:Transcript_72208/g.200280  ORF Transcript_72208/g.200280 Transcript_72208/m.200280 type:complete len:270 (+) Transcript_72208:412-1221(+)
MNQRVLPKVGGHFAQVAGEHPWLHLRQRTPRDGGDSVPRKLELRRDLLQRHLHRGCLHGAGPPSGRRDVALHLWVDTAFPVVQPPPKHVAISARQYLQVLHVVFVLNGRQCYCEHVFHDLPIKANYLRLHFRIFDKNREYLLHNNRVDTGWLHLRHASVNSIRVCEQQFPHLLSVSLYGSAKAVDLPLIRDLAPVEILRHRDHVVGLHLRLCQPSLRLRETYRRGGTTAPPASRKQSAPTQLGRVEAIHESTSAGHTVLPQGKSASGPP